MTDTTSIGGTPCGPWEPIFCCTLPAGAAAITGSMVQAATEALWARSGRRFGLCEITLRPCRRSCDGGWPFADQWWEFGTWPRPLLYQGSWFNIACGGCGSGCSCTVLEEALLPAPVNSIVQVKLNGSVMVTGSYRLDDARLLVRTDGGTWPVCQDMAAADTEDNTWSVTALFGEAVPTLGQLAVGELACELVKACVGQPCALPPNATQVSRQGVTVDLQALSELLDSGMIGLRNSDLFISTFNPNKLMAAPQVYDIDGPSFRRKTWP